MAEWVGGLAEWVDGDTAYLSIAFTWLLPKEEEIMLKLSLTKRAGKIGGSIKIGGASKKAKRLKDLI